MSLNKSNQNLQLSKPRTKADIEACVRMYRDLHDESLIETDFESAYKNLYDAVKLNKFVRIALRDSQLVAWIWADVVKPAYSKEKVFQQLFYCSNETGFASARLVLAMHDALIDEARRLGLKHVISQGSHTDEKFVMARLLEKNGWKRCGYVAIYHLTGN